MEIHFVLAKLVEISLSLSSSPSFSNSPSLCCSLPPSAFSTCITHIFLNKRNLVKGWQRVCLVTGKSLEIPAQFLSDAGRESCCAMCPGHGQDGHKLKSNVLTGPKGDCKVIYGQSWQQLLKNFAAGVDGLNGMEEGTGCWQFKECLH